MLTVVKTPNLGWTVRLVSLCPLSLLTIDSD